MPAMPERARLFLIPITLCRRCDDMPKCATSSGKTTDSQRREKPKKKPGGTEKLWKVNLQCRHVTRRGILCKGCWFLKVIVIFFKYENRRKIRYTSEKFVKFHFKFNYFFQENYSVAQGSISFWVIYIRTTMFRMGNAVKLLVSGVIVSACKSQLLAVFCVLIIAVQSSCVSFTDFLLPFLVCVFNKNAPPLFKFKLLYLPCCVTSHHVFQVSMVLCKKHASNICYLNWWCDSEGLKRCSLIWN